MKHAPPCSSITKYFTIDFDPFTVFEEDWKRHDRVGELSLNSNQTREKNRKICRGAKGNENILVMNCW
jgi:hypothetical protein